MISQQSPPPAPVRTDGGDERWRVAGLCLVLAAITFVVFWQTTGFGFLDIDDDLYVYENARVTGGLSLKGLAWFFTHADCELYHPLTMLSLVADYQLHGLQAGGYHFTNVLLHTASVILLFLILREMTGALWRSAFVAAVFAIHPLHVESVAWVAERKDVLSGLFFMLTIRAYISYARHVWSWGRYGLVGLLFAMGLMCKPMLVTLPLVLLLLDYWPLHRFEPRKLSGLILEKIPLLALAIVAGAMTVLAEKEGIAVNVSLSMPLRIANALVSCVIYLRQMIWPEGLAAFYPYPSAGLPTWEVMLAGMLLAGLSALAFWQRRKQPWLLVGWLWYLLMLLPAAGIIQVSGQAHADRYTYLPQIGICVAATWLAAEWGAKRQVDGMVFAGLMAGVVGVLMFCAWKQTAYWKNGDTLWTHALGCTTNNYVAHLNLGIDRFKKGKVDEAIAQYQIVLQINPGDTEAHYNLGLGLRKLGRLEEAIAHYQKALETMPGDADIHYNLGNIFAQQGRLDDAITQYQKALQLKPGKAEAHNNLGLALSQQGRLDEAISQYQKALEIKPAYAEAQYNLGMIFGQQGRLDEAIRCFQQALQIQPDYAEAQNWLGNCYLQLGRLDEAISHYQRAVGISPDYAEARKNLAWLLATCPQASLRDGKKAVELAERANELTGGGNPLFLCTLAAAYAETGRFSEAVETAQHALRLAGAQSNTRLAGQLQAEIKLYQAGSPFHSSQLTR